MMKEIAWNMFKSTGNIDTFLELKQIENLENNNLPNIQSKHTHQQNTPSTDLYKPKNND